MAKIDFSKYTIRFITGSQHLYGPGPLKQVADNAKKVVKALNASKEIPIKIEWVPTVKLNEEVVAAIQEANADPKCIGIICWMHTFSPAKMWINGLKILNKPMLHLNTQCNQDIPWSTMDMDFMNLNQAAHGDREFGFICTRLGLRRKVVNGYFADPVVQHEIGVWARVAAAWADSQTMKVARIGDNMREVAVTEGNKVSAQIQFGYSCNGYAVPDVLKFIDAVTDKEVEKLVKKYFDLYTVPKKGAAEKKSFLAAAKQEIGLRAFLEDGGFTAFTTTFENLYGLDQLPGLACQRLMEEGYGFGAEGDWKTAAFLRTAKVMAAGLPGGVSFMEDYTYHFEPNRQRVLGAHMLEVCPSIAAGKPSLEVHPLGIGGKADPARLVFTTKPGPAINATVIDLGDHFRLIVNELEIVKPDKKLAKLPVASTVWIPKPNLHEGARRWIEAGGAHHSVNAPSLTTEYMEDYARMAGIEIVEIK